MNNDLYDSISTKHYRVMLIHNDVDIELVNQLKQRGYTYQDIDLVNDWFLEIHNEDKTIHTDRCGTFMFLFSYRKGVRLRDLETKDILDNINKLIDEQDKDLYFLLLTDKGKRINERKKK